MALMLRGREVDFYRFPDGYLPTEFTEATDVPLTAAAAG